MVADGVWEREAQHVKGLVRGLGVCMVHTVYTHIYSYSSSSSIYTLYRLPIRD